MSRPLEISDVENISLEATDGNSDMYPQLVAQFTCQYQAIGDCIEFQSQYVCCSIVWMMNVTHAAIQGINVKVTTPNVSGVILQQCSHLHIQSIIYCSIPGQNSDSNGFMSNEYGIVAYESNGIEMNSLKAGNFSTGVRLYKSRNSNMTNVSAAHNGYQGINLYHSTGTSMTNISAANNGDDGVDLDHSTDTIMMNVSAAHNGDDGIHLDHSTDTIMMNVSAAHNGDDGIDLDHSTEASMMNVSAAHNGDDGIHLDHSTDTIMMTVSASHNGDDGIDLDHSTEASMMNVSAAHNGDDGTHLDHSTDTSIMNVSAAHNGDDGIDLDHSTEASIMNVSAAHNGDDGIHLDHSTDTSMMNVSAAYNGDDGIDLNHYTNIRITNVSASHNGENGIESHNSTKISMTNVSAARNGVVGILLFYSTDTSMTNVSVAHNGVIGILLHYSTDTNVMNISAAHNQRSDITMISTANTYIANTTSLITAINTTNIVLIDMFFINMDAPSTASSASEPTSLPAVITLYSSTLIIRDCTFTRNKISSIKAIGSNVTMSGKVLFHNNTASSGTVLISAKNSLLIISDYSNIHFQNNHAINYGGVFYIINEELYGLSMSLQDIIFDINKGTLITSRTECFIHAEGSRSYAQFTFINNTAGKGGDVLYGGLVSLGYDGDWNCLLSFKNISDMSQQSGLSRISSAPSRVCLCNETGQPDCLTVADPTTRVIYPGQTITIPAVVVGQDFGTVTGSVFAQSLHTTDSVYMEQKQDNLAIGQNQCSNLEYTIFSQSEESAAVLVLTHDNRDISQLMNEEDNQEIINTWDKLNKESNYKTLAHDIICDFINFTSNNGFQFTVKYNESNLSGNRTIEDFNKFTPASITSCESVLMHTKFVFPKEIYSYPVYINVSFCPCPPGFLLSKHMPFRCDCNQLMKQLPGVKCHIQDQTISRSELVWIGTDGNETVAALNCPYNYCSREDINVTLEDPDSQCNFKHSGTLCGGCQPGLSLALGSNQCLHCSNTHLALLLPFALAGVVLVCFIKVLDLTISQGTLNGLIFYANIVKANEHLLYYNEKQTNPLAVFIAWLNLDLGIETCFCKGLTAYGKTWLQFVFPLYIWSIAGLIIILAKHSDRVAKLMGNNSVPVLATLFLLSYAKLFRTIITVLSFTMLSTTHGSKVVWSADGNLDYLGPEHAPLFAVAAATLLFLWLPYTLLLFLGQWLYRCNCRLTTCTMMKIKPFLDAHYGPLNGNHRYWFGALLLVRAVILLLSALVPTNNIITVFSINVCVIVLVTCLAIGVYRSFAVATFNAVWFANLGILSASHMFTDFDEDYSFLAVICLFGLAFAQFIGLIFFKVVVVIKCRKRVVSCLRRGQPTEDDWELYEQAASQREIESEDEGEKSEVSGSINSLPTYGF